MFYQIVNVIAFTPGYRSGQFGQQLNMLPLPHLNCDCLMNAAEIEQLEQQLAVRLPSVWTKHLLHYPQRVRDLRRPDGTSVTEFELCDELELLRQFNEEVRLEPIIDCHGFEFDWPEAFVVIGDNEMGDYYCIDADDPDGRVMCLDSQLCEVFEVTETLDEFIDYLVETYGDNSRTEKAAE